MSEARDMGVFFSKKSDEWETDWDFFKPLDKRFNFTLDAAATRETAKAARFFSLEDDALTQSWARNSVWLNPPYSKLRDFMAKAKFEATQKGTRVVCLVPARTDTRWWHDNIPAASDVWFIKGRLKFGGMKNSAPFPSALVIFQAGSTQPVFQAYDPRADRVSFWGHLL